jgi:uncharacterized protein
MQAIVRERLTEVAALCRSLGVRRLELFGSAARDDFGPASDIDFLVTLDVLPPQGYAERYFDLKEGLEALFDRPVDLLTDASVLNPYLRAHIRADSIRVFEA